MIEYMENGAVIKYNKNSTLSNKLRTNLDLFVEGTYFYKTELEPLCMELLSGAYAVEEIYTAYGMTEREFTELTDSKDFQDVYDRMKASLAEHGALEFKLSLATLSSVKELIELARGEDTTPSQKIGIYKDILKMRLDTKQEETKDVSETKPLLNVTLTHAVSRTESGD